MATVAMHTPGPASQPRVSNLRPAGSVRFAPSPSANVAATPSASHLLSKFEFLDGFPKSLACSICCDPFNQPVETPRGQVFCRPCIQIWLENNHCCPLDQAPLKVAELRPINRVLSGLIDELPVQCKSCDAQMKRGQIAHHIGSECIGRSASSSTDATTARSALSPLAWNTPLPQRSSMKAKHGLSSQLNTPAGLPGWDSPEAPDSLVKKGAKHRFDSPLAATTTTTAAGASPINLNTRNDLHQGVKYTLIEGSFTALPDFPKMVLAAGSAAGAVGIRTGVCGNLSLAELSAVGDLDAKYAAAASGGGGKDGDNGGRSAAGADEASSSSASAAGKGKAKRTGKAASSGTLRDFAVKYEAIIQIPVSGVYTFYVGSNDGSKLVIDGSPIVDNDGVHYYGEKEGAVELSSGR